MIKSVSFQTRARTVDHLGREQIADTPTAVSELWKNAYDAYATLTELNIYDGNPPIASLVDNGHGMNSDEFVNRWLVIGTESKANSDTTPKQDRNGLPARIRQGQKGIGRLSCANLGPILFLISKRANTDFVAALVDWRLFENPYLNLSDIQIPVIEFSKKEELFKQIPSLTTQLLENVSGGSSGDRRKRIEDAWALFDKMHNEEHGVSNNRPPPSKMILSSMNKVTFEERHLERWPVWAGQSSHGTALLVADVNDALTIELEEQTDDSSNQRTKDRFFETLSSFVDPFIDLQSQSGEQSDIPFRYSVRAWKNGNSRLVLGTEKQFDLATLQPMEHQVEGVVGDDGVFRGRVKAFGKWVSDECVIEPPNDLKLPIRSNSIIGPFSLYIASMEFTRGNTTHSIEEFEHYQRLAGKYAGFMMYRDGLRVLPFGRPDNDFFEIENRRSKNAGREFWNHRQMFGRIAISRYENPNLTDKAGREGILDNQAAKALRELVSYILMQLARQYFGSASELRTDFLPEIRESNKKERAKEARNKLRKRQHKEFRRKLKEQSIELPIFATEIKEYLDSFEIKDENEIEEAQETIEGFKNRSIDFRLPGAPKKLGNLEKSYNEYRDINNALNANIKLLIDRCDIEVERISPTQPHELLKKQLARNAAQIHARIQVWKKSINTLQTEEFQRIKNLIDERNKLFHREASPMLHRLETGELNFQEVSKLMERLKERLDAENAEMFIPYIGALESLKESVDLEHLATFGLEELSDLRSELERLNALAQLGIAVEIVGHELQSYDEMIGSGLRHLPEKIQQSKAAKNIEFGYEGLTDQLRFLSPLRLGGNKDKNWITGNEIYLYISNFFKIILANNDIQLNASNSFKAFRVFDQQSRLYPVFINLINNSIYWLSAGNQNERQIFLDIVGDEVVVSDNGPGVNPEDLESLFTLFFTKKARGGRGVGLYLSRANLTAGGHAIRYEPAATDMPLAGANFLIQFRGGEFENE